MYTFFADDLDLDTFETWVANRGADVQYGRITFRSDRDRKDRGFLDLMREWVVEGRVERYDGPVGITIEDGYGAEGVTGVELGREHLRLALNEVAAAAIEDEAILVEFDFDDAEFAQLRRELLAMFAGLLDVREV